MTDWYVEIAARSGRTLSPAETEQAEDLVGVLAAHGAAVAIGGKDVRISLTVTAPRSEAGHAKAVRLVEKALAEAGLSHLRIAAALVRSEGEMDEDLARPTLPKLMGVAEVARRLGVSRQRVSELARRKGFPAPVAKLAAGPVWLESSVARFASEWTRKPGRQAAVQPGA